MSSGERKSTNGRRAEGLAGAEAALRRAARRAQQRAREAANASAERQSKGETGDTMGVETGRDPHRLTFSQAQGYEEIPGDPPTIVPAVTADEGTTIIESLKTLREAGLRGSAGHLREASECINRGDWAGSIRESIHAVESVARQIAPEETDTLTQALNSIDQRRPLHSNLKDSLKSLYWYTSDEQGIRHSLLDREKGSVGMDEAVFMLGACASFAGYLWRKHAAGGAP